MKNLIHTLCLCSILVLSSCKKSNPAGGGGGTNPSTKAITSFVFKAADNPGLAADVNGIITGDTIRLSVPNNVSIINLKPTIVHTGKSISPGSGSSQDFSVIVGYKVTATDNSEKIYKAIVSSSIGGTMYIGSADGKLYALDTDNGSLKWTYTTGGSINNASPTIYNGTVFICSSDRYLYAVDASTGLLKWKFFTAGDVSEITPTLYNGNLYFGVRPGSGGLYSINAQTGAVNWQRSGIQPASNMTITDGKAYAGHFGGLVGYDINTGAAVQGFPGAWIYGPGNPLAGNGIIYTGREASVTTAYNTATGALIWNFSGALNDHCLYSGPTAKNGTIYNGGAVTGKLYAMDSITGVMRWIYSDNNTFSSPLVANNTVYVGNANSFFYAIDAGMGTLKWKFGDPGSRSVGINNGTVVGNMVYFGSYNKNIYCLNAYTGAVIWQFATGGAVYSGPLIVTNTQQVYHPGLSGEQQ